MMSPRRTVALAACLLLTPLAACGGDDGGGEDELGDVAEENQGTGGPAVKASREDGQKKPTKIAP